MVSDTATNCIISSESIFCKYSHKNRYSWQYDSLTITKPVVQYVHTCILYLISKSNYGN